MNSCKFVWHSYELMWNSCEIHMDSHTFIWIRAKIIWIYKLIQFLAPSNVRLHAFGVPSGLLGSSGAFCWLHFGCIVSHFGYTLVTLCYTLVTFWLRCGDGVVTVWLRKCYGDMKSHLAPSVWRFWFPFASFLHFSWIPNPSRTVFLTPLCNETMIFTRSSKPTPHCKRSWPGCCHWCQQPSERPVSTKWVPSECQVSAKWVSSECLVNAKKSTLGAPQWAPPFKSRWAQASQARFQMLG